MTDAAPVLRAGGESMLPDYKQQIMFSASLVPAAYCLNHRQMCPVIGADTDQSGSPCQDWSAAGEQKGINGKHLVCFLTYARIHTWWGTPLVIHENVPQFMIQLAIVHLPGHTVYNFEITPADVGFSHVARTRQYLVCVQNQKCQLKHDIYVMWGHVKEALRNSIRPHEGVFATSAEVYAEEAELSQVRRIEKRPNAQRPNQTYLLSAAEQSYVRHLNTEYFIRTKQRAEADPDLVYNLSDNPQNRTSWSFSSGIFPTFRRNSNRLWLPAFQRFMTRSERLAALGFPSCSSLALMCGGDQVAMDSASANFLLGNAMHVAVASSIHCTALACIIRL